MQGRPGVSALSYVAILYLNWHNSGVLPDNLYQMDVRIVRQLFILQREVHRYLKEVEEQERLEREQKIKMGLRV